MDVSTVESPPQTTAKPAILTPIQRQPRFTRENAADFARASTRKRMANKRLRDAAQGPPDSAQYITSRLTRVRAQLAKLDGLIDTETDPAKLDRLVCAQNRLSEQWRIFSGIPLPGSRRPGRESTSKAPSSFEPSE